MFFYVYTILLWKLPLTTPLYPKATLTPLLHNSYYTYTYDHTCEARWRSKRSPHSYYAYTNDHTPENTPSRTPPWAGFSPSPPLQTPMPQEHIPPIHSPSPISQPQQNKAIRQQKNKKNDKKFARFKKKPYLCIRNHQDCDFHQVNIGLVAQLVRATDS